MDDLRFFQLFGDIDADIVQQANDDLNAWQEAQKGVVVRAGSPRKMPLKIVFASVACAAVLFGAVFLLRNYLKNGFMYEPVNSSDSSVQSGENSVAEGEYTLNSDVIWALGKTMGELTERYGEVTGDGLRYSFKNGYGIYGYNDGECISVLVNASDLLKGDLSTVTLDNMASKFGLENYSYDLHPISSFDDDNYGTAGFTHPSYEGLRFIISFKKNGLNFDAENAQILVRYDDDISESEISINSDVMWGLGKTMDELTERYGEIVGSTGQTAWFKNGYGIYAWSVEGGSCTRISRIKASDILIGDLSTVNFDNIVSKCGFDVILFEPGSDGPGMYDDAKVAYFSHPSYENITFQMTYKISGFDEDATFLIRYDDNSSNPSGEPTFLVGPDGKPIYTSEITRLENTDKTAETLTEDDQAAEVYCDGFAYYKEPCGIGYNNYKNPEMFGKGQFVTRYIGEVPENTNEWKRVYVGDEIFGLKVKSATAHFYVYDWDDLTFPSRYYYDNDMGIELEGTIEAEGFLQIYKRTVRYPETSEMIWFYPSTIDLPLNPLSIGFADNEKGFVTEFRDRCVYDHTDEFLYAGEFEDVHLGYLANVNCDLDGLGVGDIAYARVTLSNITCFRDSATATLEKVELLSDILAHDDDDPGAKPYVPNQ